MAALAAQHQRLLDSLASAGGGLDLGASASASAAALAPAAAGSPELAARTAAASAAPLPSPQRPRGTSMGSEATMVAAVASAARRRVEQRRVEEQHRREAAAEASLGALGGGGNLLGGLRSGPGASALASLLSSATSNLGAAARTPAAHGSPHRLEHVRQGLMTAHTFLSAVAPSVIGECIAPATEAADPSSLTRGALRSSPSVRRDDLETADALEISTDERAHRRRRQRRRLKEREARLLAQQRERRLERSAVARGDADVNANRTSIARKHFFVGQWIDAKDTVNQWLEATVLRLITNDSSIPDRDGQLSYDSDGGYGRPFIDLQHEHEQRKRHAGGNGGRAMGGMDEEEEEEEEEEEGSEGMGSVSDAMDDDEGEGGDDADAPGVEETVLAAGAAADASAAASLRAILGVTTGSNALASGVAGTAAAAVRPPVAPPTAGAHVYVHYNGWPSRWDEWIPVDSPRLAPFRTRTSRTTHTT